MSEFVNVTEVEKLPLGMIDSLIAIDSENNIKRTSIKVDSEVKSGSTNPVSSDGVFDALEELRGETGNTIDDVRLDIQDIDSELYDLRDDLRVLNDQLDDYAEEVDKDLQTINNKISDVTDKVDTELKKYATIEYVNEIVDGINTALDQINGEVV